MARSSDVERRRRLVQRMQGEGVEAAYAACLAISKDPKAPAPARASASAAILRIGGYFDPGAAAIADEIEDVAEPVTLAEIDARLRLLEMELGEHDSDPNSDVDDATEEDGDEDED